MLAGKYNSPVSEHFLTDKHHLRMKKIQDLKLQAFLPYDKDNSMLDLAMWYSDENVCARQEDGGCITKDGIYFGTDSDTEPTFCPLHFFADEAYTISATA